MLGTNAGCSAKCHLLHPLTLAATGKEGIPGLQWKCVLLHTLYYCMSLWMLLLQMKFLISLVQLGWSGLNALTPTPQAQVLLPFFLIVFPVLRTDLVFTNTERPNLQKLQMNI